MIKLFTILVFGPTALVFGLVIALAVIVAGVVLFDKAVGLG